MTETQLNPLSTGLFFHLLFNPIAEVFDSTEKIKRSIPK